MSRDEVLIVPYQDGPYLVRGPVVIRDQEGGEINLTRHPVALCRCGKSRMRPFCDGTHRLVRFAAPSPAETHRFAPRVSLHQAVPSTRGPADEPGLSAPRRALGRVKESLAAQLATGPHLAGEHFAMRAAEPLIGAAWYLLGERRTVAGREALQDIRPPVRHLIRGAVEVLSPAACADDSPLSELISLLEGLLGLLEAEVRRP
jgi:CDGSH-type Zn-finger protein